MKQKAVLLGGVVLGVLASAVAQQTRVTNMLMQYSHVVLSVIDSTPIGQTTPAAGAFTNVTTGALTATTANITGAASASSFSTANLAGNVINANNLQVAGGAPNQHVLCGNGTYYVDAATCGPGVQGTQYAVVRSAGVTYTNTTGSLVIETGWFATSGSSTGTLHCSVNGTVIYPAVATATVDGGSIPFSFPVPVGATYSCYGDGGVNRGVGGWFETPLK